MAKDKQVSLSRTHTRSFRTLGAYSQLQKREQINLEQLTVGKTNKSAANYEPADWNKHPVITRRAATASLTLRETEKYLCKSVASVPHGREQT